MCILGNEVSKWILLNSLQILHSRDGHIRMTAAAQLEAVLHLIDS